jgi:spore germination protein AB
MAMKQSLPENVKISPFLIFYIIVSIQIGIGVLGYQRIIAKTAGYDAWMSVIAAGASIHIILWMMYKTAENAGGDLISINSFVFGKKIGKLVSLIFSGYYILLTATILRTYIEVIQVWLFPELSTFWFSFGFLVLAAYVVSGGLRAVTGVAFLGAILPSYLMLTFAFAIPFSDYRNLFPVLDHSIKDLALAARDMSLTYLGYEILLLVYPFLKDPGKSKKWAHLAIFTTTSLYAILTIITFGYFSEMQLQKTVWATLTMWKIVEMPFVERFEYIGIANWNLIILPNACLAIWAASRIVKRVAGIRQRKNVIGIILICLAVTNVFETREQIDLLNNISSQFGFYFNYGYVPLLFAGSLIAKKVRKK